MKQYIAPAIAIGAFLLAFGYSLYSDADHAHEGAHEHPHEERQHN